MFHSPKIIHNLHNISKSCVLHRMFCLLTLGGVPQNPKKACISACGHLALKKQKSSPTQKWRIDRPILAPSGPSPQTTPRWVWHRDEAGKADAIPGSVRTWVLLLSLLFWRLRNWLIMLGVSRNSFLHWYASEKKCLEKDPDAQPPTIYHLKSQLCCLTSGSGC